MIFAILIMAISSRLQGVEKVIFQKHGVNQADNFEKVELVERGVKSLKSPLYTIPFQ